MRNPIQTVKNFVFGGDKYNRIVGSIFGVFGGKSNSGQTVTLEKALEIATVWACISRTAQFIASMPLGVYEKEDSGNRIKQSNSMSRLLNESPNAHQTAIEFWEGMIAWMLANGNGYAEILRIGGKVVALEPLPSDRIEPFRDEVNSLMYRVYDGDSERVLPQKDVFHLKGFGFGGDQGLSAIRYGVNTLGLAMSAEESAGSYFSSGMQIGGFIKSQHALNPEQKKQLSENLSKYAGSKNTAKIMTLESGFDFVPVSLNPEDAQLLEARKFNVEEICRWFGMPPIIIGHASEGQTMWGTGVEQITLSWLQTGLNPILCKIEKRIQKQLISNPRQYAEFNREAAVQMDGKSKMDMLSRGVTNAIIKPDEARHKLNMGSVKGGDQLFAQTALAPIQTLGKGHEERESTKSSLDDSANLQSGD